MKRQLLVSLVLLGATSAVFAQDMNATSTTSRADVKAATRAANKSGTLSAGGEAGVPATTAPETDASRAAVKAKTRAGVKTGDVRVRTNFDGSLTPHAPTDVKRADVKSDTRAAAKTGDLKAGGEIGTQPGANVTPAK